MRRTGRSRYSTLSQINVTNLVDICLVLLVIFILAAPLLKEGIDVNMPETTSAEALDVEEPILVTVTREKEIYLDSHRYTRERIGEYVRVAQGGTPDRPVLLKADAALEYGYVMLVLDEIRKAGVEQASLVTRPPDLTETAEPARL